MSIGFTSKLLAALDPNKRVSLSFKALKAGIDFSLAMKVLDGVFFQHKDVSSTLKIYTKHCSNLQLLSQLDRQDNLL